MPAFGTRTRATKQNNHPSRGSSFERFDRDTGLSKRSTGSFTFGSGKITGSNGSFSAFKVNDLVLAQGAVLNSGQFLVTAIDGVNAAFLTVDPAPKSETITCTVRTA